MRGDAEIVTTEREGEDPRNTLNPRKRERRGRPDRWRRPSHYAATGEGACPTTATLGSRGRLPSLVLQFQFQQAYLECERLLHIREKEALQAF